MTVEKFEVRLVGGYRMWWSTITPLVAGHLRVLKAPKFYTPTFAEGMLGIWDLWPIDNLARPHPLQETERLTRPVHVTQRTIGVALISAVDIVAGQAGGLYLELFLSDKEPAPDGSTVCHEWANLLRRTKDDPSEGAILSLELQGLTNDEIAGFYSQKKIVTSNMTLDLRRRS